MVPERGSDIYGPPRGWPEAVGRLGRPVFTGVWGVSDDEPVARVCCAVWRDVWHAGTCFRLYQSVVC